VLASHQERMVPHNVDAEEAVLGSCLIDSGAVAKVYGRLEPGDFYRERNAAVWRAMLDAFKAGEPTDVLIVSHRLQAAGHLEEVGGHPYLSSLADSVPTAVHIEHYAKLVGDAAVRRRLIGAAGQVAGLAYEGEGEPDEILARAGQLVLGARGARRQLDLRAAPERAMSAAARLTAQQTGTATPGLPWGFRWLDETTKGLYGGQLALIAGRPSMGKTSLMLCAAMRQARRGARVLFASKEMSEEALTARQLAVLAHVDVQDVVAGTVTPEEYDRLAEALSEVQEEQISVLDDPLMNVASIYAAAVQMQARDGLDIIYADYLQLIARHEAGSDEYARASAASVNLKGLARQVGVPVVVGTQLSRECERRDDKRPVLSDLRDSGTLEQDADLVLMLYRDSVYYDKATWEERERKRPKKSSLDTPRPYPENVCEVLVRKQRQGPANKSVRLAFLGRYAEFAELTSAEDRWV